MLWHGSGYARPEMGPWEITAALWVRTSTAEDANFASAPVPFSALSISFDNACGKQFKLHKMLCVVLMAVFLLPAQNCVLTEIRHHRTTKLHALGDWQYKSSASRLLCTFCAQERWKKYLDHCIRLIRYGAQYCAPMVCSRAQQCTLWDISHSC